MRYLSWIGAIVLGSVVSEIVFLGTALGEKPAPPNILLIVADDLGWADVSSHGTEIRTPNLDRLAAEGAELSRFYACPICSPTRAGLMTGRYPIRFGLMRAVLPPWRQGGLDPAEVTLADVLARAGYEHRGVFGKWHLGHSDIAYHPLRRGFTEFVGHYNGAIDYFTHQREDELDWHHDYEPGRESGYSTDLIADAATRFIDRHAGEGSPFLCYVPFNAPHGPLQAKLDDLEDYEHLADAANAQNRKAKNPKGRNPTSKQQPPRSKRNNYGSKGRGQSPRQTLAAMISSMDQGIGKLLEALDRNQIADETLVWFFSDNGGTRPGDNRPLRGAKTMAFEGGIRVVASLRWPDRIPAGTKIDAPLAYIDVLPTVMRIAGIDDHRGKPLDGIDALDLLTGKQTDTDRELYSYIGQQGEASEQIALTETRWKLLVIGPKITDRAADPSRREIFLFDIVTDPNETTNLAGRHPEIVARMRAKLETFRALQPSDAVPPYAQRDPDFQAPPEWKIPDNSR